MPLYERLFRALDASETRYVVVGGVATVLHGYARLTADVDLIILKRLADRPRDRDDIEKLEQIARLRERSP